MYALGGNDRCPLYPLFPQIPGHSQLSSGKYRRPPGSEDLLCLLEKSDKVSSNDVNLRPCLGAWGSRYSSRFSIRPNVLRFVSPLLSSLSPSPSPHPPPPFPP